MRVVDGLDHREGDHHAIDPLSDAADLLSAILPCLSTHELLSSWALHCSARAHRARAEMVAFVDGGLGPMPVERRPTTHAYWTEVALALGCEREARVLYDQLIPWEGQIVVGGMAETPLGAVDRYLGMLATAVGNYKDAEARFLAAIHIEDGLAAPPLRARTRYWYGRMLLARADPADSERAAELLASARDAAQRLGMASLHRQVIAELA